ncbi:thiol:disulfide interchange protein TlpA [Rhodobium gokarnense]
MTTHKAGVSRLVKVALAAGMVGIVAGLAAVYGIGGMSGNGNANPQCQAAEAIAGRITPYRTGDVAGFIPTSQSRFLADLAFTDADGKAMTVADFAGKTVLLNLWATWCAPCRKEMPTLDALQEAMGGGDFDVVAVNIDRRNPERARQFYEQIGVENLAFYADPSSQIFEELKKRGRAIGMPTTLLVDKKGCEIGVLHGIAEWDSPDAKALITAAMDETK